MDIILLLIAIFSNTGLAARKGQPPARWGFYTLLAFFGAAMIFGGIFLYASYDGPLTPEGMQAYAKAVQEDTLKSMIVAVLGLGGALFVRYRLQRLPDAPSEKRGRGEDS